MESISACLNQCNTRLLQRLACSCTAAVEWMLLRLRPCCMGPASTSVQAPMLTNAIAPPAAHAAADVAAPGSLPMKTDSSTVKLNMSRRGPCTGMSETRRSVLKGHWWHIEKPLRKLQVRPTHVDYMLTAPSCHLATYQLLPNALIVIAIHQSPCLWPPAVRGLTWRLPSAPCQACSCLTTAYVACDVGRDRQVCTPLVKSRLLSAPIRKAVLTSITTFLDHGQPDSHLPVKRCCRRCCRIRNMSTADWLQQWLYS